MAGKTAKRLDDDRFTSQDMNVEMALIDSDEDSPYRSDNDDGIILIRFS